MYYFVFVYSAEKGKFHLLVELQAPLLLFTGPNMHGCLSQRALGDFNTSFFANLNWFSSLLPGGLRGLSEWCSTYLNLMVAGVFGADFGTRPGAL